MITANAQLADRLAWKRARAAQVLAFLFIATQAGSFSDAPTNRPQVIHLAAWLWWGAALLVFLALALIRFGALEKRALGES